MSQYLSTSLLSRLVSGCFFLVVISSSVNAHEMWFEPLEFEIAKGDKLLAHEKVGQHFKGNKYAYLDSSFEQIAISINGTSRLVKSRLGSLPAVQELISEEGLCVLSAETSASKITYKNRETFDKFIKAEGLDWVFEAHKQRGLPDIGFTEVYRRYPKALIKVGEGKGRDIPLGKIFEWVAITNPYHTKDFIKLQLLWQGEPYPNAQATVFTKTVSIKTEGIVNREESTKTSYITDSKGYISVALNHDDIYLINAVKMIEPNSQTSHSYGAVWESLWASMTFKSILEK